METSCRENGKEPSDQTHIYTGDGKDKTNGQTKVNMERQTGRRPKRI